jgi:hypothetical protein
MDLKMKKKDHYTSVYFYAKFEKNFPKEIFKMTGKRQLNVSFIPSRLLPWFGF